jgi:predicted secreted protein
VPCFVDILRTILFKKEGVEESIGTEESAPSGCRMTSIVLVGTTTCAGPYVAAYVYVSMLEEGGGRTNNTQEPRQTI